MTSTGLSAELWETIAKFCVQTHELRTVYDVAQDLSSLQSVYKTSSTCAVGLWPSVAKLCHQTTKRLAQDTFNPALARDLPSTIRTIYIQVQIDKATPVRFSEAKRQYHLTASDLQTCQENKYAAIEAAKQRVEQWEASAEGQAQLAEEEKNREDAAAAFPGGA